MRFILAAVLSLFALPALAQDRPIAIDNAMILDGHESRPILDGRIVFQNGRITAVGPRHRIAIPQGAAVLDAGGHTVMPGLIDGHLHLDLVGHGNYDDWYTFLDNNRRLPEAMQIAAKQILRAGVTTAIDLGAPFEILDARKRIDSGDMPGPRMIVSGPWITRIKLDGVPDSYQRVITTPAQAAKEVNDLIDRGSDVIKLWDGLTAGDYVAAVDAAHKRGVPVHAHLYDPEKIRMAIDAGVDVLQHVGSARNAPYPPALVAEIAQKRIPIVQTVAHRIWVYPATQAFPSRLKDPRLRADMPADFYAELQKSFMDWERQPYFKEIGMEMRRSKAAARQFIDANAYMGVGSDAASPLNFHMDAMWYELRGLIESGMTPLQALSAATKTNAEILGVGKERGTLAPGKQADIIVLQGNPLANIDTLSDVRIVIKGGQIWTSESNRIAIEDGLSQAF